MIREAILTYLIANRPSGFDVSADAENKDESFVYYQQHVGGWPIVQYMVKIGEEQITLSGPVSPKGQLYLQDSCCLNDPAGFDRIMSKIANLK